VLSSALALSRVLKWFRAEGESNVEPARRLRERFEAGELRVLAPSLLWLEVLNVSARRWRWTQDQLDQLAQTLPGLGFELLDLDLTQVARWAARGLTAYDAAYVAVAEGAGVELITDDAEIVRVAPELAIALAHQ